MQIKNTTASYGNIAKGLHWLMAILVISMLAVGLYMEGLDLSPQKLLLYGWHKSFGALILILAILRLTWRLSNPTPALPHTLPTLQHIAAHGVHALLYVLLFLMPLTGWLMSSAAGFPVSFFGLFTLPNLIEANKEWRMFFGDAHEILAFSLIALLVAHVGAALLHHFYYKDTILKRMLP